MNEFGIMVALLYRFLVLVKEFGDVLELEGWW